MDESSFIFEKKKSIFLIVSISLILFFICFNDYTISIRFNKSLYFFINRIFGYKFLNKTFCLKLSAILTIFSSIYFYKDPKYRKVFFEGVNKFYFFFFISMVLASIFSAYPVTHLQISLIFFFFTSYLFLVSVYYLFKNFDEYKLLNIFFSIIILCSLLEAFLGIYHYFNFKSFGWRFLREHKVHAHHIHIPSKDSTRWILDAIFRNTNFSKVLRANGTFAHPNLYAAYMLFSTIASLYFYIFSKKNKARIFTLICLFIQIFSIWISISRAGILGFFIFQSIFFSLLIFYRFFKKQNFNKIVIKRALKISLLSLIFSFTCLILFYSMIVGKGGVVNYSKVAKGSDANRVKIFKVGVDAYKTSPYFGIGIENFNLKKTKFVDESVQIGFFDKIHNIYLLILTENGVFTFLIFLIFLFYIYYVFFTSRKSILSILCISFISVMLMIGMVDFYLIEKFSCRIYLLFPVAIISALSQKQKLKCNHLHI